MKLFFLTSGYEEPGGMFPADMTSLVPEDSWQVSNGLAESKNGLRRVWT
jgi:hypothetical protein